MPSKFRRHHEELAEYNGLSDVGKAAYDQARIRRDAAHHHEAIRAATETGAPPAAPSSQRPALKPPPTTSTTNHDSAGGLSDPIGLGTSAGGLDR